jgi:hypothetical protein
MKKILRQIHLYTVLIQVISTIFTDQMLAFNVFREVDSMLASKFLTLYNLISEVLRMKRHNLKLHEEDTYKHTPFTL